MTAAVSTASLPASFSGIWPALLTPLDERLDIDLDAFAAHSKALLAAGCQGVTPFGTTGEGPSFSMAERLAAAEGLVARGVPASQILVSTSCAALPETVELSRHATELGAHGVLVLPPFFLKGVPEQGVIDAYCRVIDQVADPRLKFYLYHIPQVSGVALSDRVIETLLAMYPGTIVGLKDSGCIRAESVARAERFMARLTVYVGNEPDLQVLGSMGSKGAVSGLANRVPRLVQRLVQGYAAPGAAHDQQRVTALLKILGGYGLTAALKGIMAVHSGQPGWLRVRPPLVALSDAEFTALAAQLRDYAIDPQND